MALGKEGGGKRKEGEEKGRKGRGFGQLAVGACVHRQVLPGSTLLPAGGTKGCTVSSNGLPCVASLSATPKEVSKKETRRNDQEVILLLALPQKSNQWRRRAPKRPRCTLFDDALASVCLSALLGENCLKCEIIFPDFKKKIIENNAYAVGHL